MIKNDVHSGHRRRIVERFLKCGPEGFADYEILEMLLFATNRYCDTNPLSKSVLRAVRGFPGLLRASREDLLRIDRIGEKSADLLLSLQNLCNIIKKSIGISSRSKNGAQPKSSKCGEKVELCDRATIGKMLVNYFSDKEQHEIIAIAVDNGNCISSYKKLFDTDYQSGAVRGGKIIEYARQSKAAGIILAHNHPFGVAYASVGDIATNKMMESALSSLGIFYANHYVVSGNSYYPMMHNKSNTVYSFFDNEGRNLELADAVSDGEDESIPETLYSIYSRVTDIDKALLFKAYSECRGIEDFLSIRPQALMKKLSVRARDAVLFNIMTEISIRSITNSYKSGVRYSDEKICDFLRASFFGADGEYMGVVSFDGEHRLLGFDRSARGIINFVALGPQLALEWVGERGAKEIYVAHNHPNGGVEPSYTDLTTVGKLEKMFAATGVYLSKAVIVSGGEYQLINLQDYDLSKLK